VSRGGQYHCRSTPLPSAHQGSTRNRLLRTRTRG
jgi:hypothetical protein